MTNLTAQAVKDYFELLRKSGKYSFDLGHKGNNCEGTIKLAAPLNPTIPMEDQEWLDTLMRCEKCGKIWTIDAMLKVTSDADVNLRWGMKSGRRSDEVYQLVKEGSFFRMIKTSSKLGPNQAKITFKEL